MLLEAFDAQIPIPGNMEEILASHALELLCMSVVHFGSLDVALTAISESINVASKPFNFASKAFNEAP